MTSKTKKLLTYLGAAIGGFMLYNHLKKTGVQCHGARWGESLARERGRCNVGIHGFIFFGLAGLKQYLPGFETLH